MTLAPLGSRRLIAERLGVSVSQVSRWERPDGPIPQRGHRQRLAKVYKVPVSELGLSD